MENEKPKLTDEEKIKLEEQLRYSARFYPYRTLWGYRDDDGELKWYASKTRKPMLAAKRKGFDIYQLV